MQLYTQMDKIMKSQEKRQMNERSLANLELGAKSRKLGKVRHNFTIMPDSMEWLRGTGNASDAIDSLVQAARNGGLNSDNTHERIEQENQESIDVYERNIQDLKRDLEETQLELSKTRSLLEASRKMERETMELVVTCHQDGFRAAEILKPALEVKLRSAAGETIKQRIREALELIDDV